MATIADVFSLAWMHHQAGNFRQAEQLYQQLLQIDPYHLDANFKLANVLFLQGNYSAAITRFRTVVQLKPDYVVAHYNLGLALQRAAKPAEAVDSYRQAIQLQPTLLLAWNNLGIALKGLGRLDEAIGCYRHVLQVRPDSAEFHVNLANALAEQSKFDEAMSSYQQALRLNPNDPETYYNLAIALGKCDKNEEAAAAFRKTLQFKPDHVEAYYYLGIIYQEQGKMQEALAYYDRALQWDPHHGATHLNRALIFLLQGDWARGWSEYEWRWTQPGFARHPCTEPQWDGSPLDGRTILVYAEQGLGDTIQFIRYLPLLKQAGGRVIFECQAPLQKLLSNFARIDRLLVRGSDLPAFDLHVPLINLPGLFRSTPANVPATVPYLQANAALVEHWRQELAPLRGLKVGIAWQGNPGNPVDRFRSIPVAHFARLAQVEGVSLVSVQKGPGTDQIAALAGQMPLLDLSERLDTTSGPFMDTAAVLKNLDLVISADTAVPHLAGALAVPVWVALHTVPDWRWLLQRDDSPWYPTMRLFRQTTSGNWDTVFEAIAGELRALVAATPAGLPGR